MSIFIWRQKVLHWTEVTIFSTGIDCQPNELMANQIIFLFKGYALQELFPSPNLFLLYLSDNSFSAFQKITYRLSFEMLRSYCRSNKFFVLSAYKYRSATASLVYKQETQWHCDIIRMLIKQKF